MKRCNNPGNWLQAPRPYQVDVLPEANIDSFIRSRFSAWHVLLLKAVFLLLILGGISILPVAAQNAIVLENAKTGNPASEWQISGAGDLSIQGFATDISYNKGETARFNIKTSARAYTIAIYRLGFYQGNGARLQGTGTVTATLPQSQPNCLTNSSTGLLDCGNWAVSAQWAIPSTAVSGLYLAKLTRTDTGGSSHIVFIVRDDASTSDLLFQTSDATWQAYNVYGDNNNGKSLYTGSGGKAVKVSYNRPFLTRNGGGGGGPSEDWLFNAEYPMIRWIESNGYDVTYTTNVDSDRRGELIKNHKVFLSVGHDEYWSGAHRAHVTAARDAGTSLAFFSGNEVYWKTRWENSIDGSGTTYRTLVCYKEGSSGENTCNGKCDPSPEWTGLWRSGCEYRTGDILVDGCQPENALTGQISWEENTVALQVPGTYGQLRFWRNTSVASLGSGQTATLTSGTIGYEWNAEQEAYRSTYPNGRILLSRTVINGKVHHLTLYKHTSGALVFGAGTVQYSWGLDSNHDRGSAAPSTAMQQATVNLFADMGAQPGSLRPGLVAATASTDTQAPVTTITSPAEGTNLAAGAAVTITGTASDANVIAGVEVSTDGGNSWRLANGTANWSFSWTPTTQGAAAIRARAFDDSGNIGVPVVVNVTIGGGTAPTCPCTVFQASTTPSGSLQNDGQALQLGMKFRSSTNGFVTGVRFYKQTGNTGTHTGQLYSSTGTLLASVVFQNETASGWQQASFSSPVAVTAGTTYLISYHSSGGGYSADDNGFSQAVVNGPLTGLQNGVDGANGVYRYTSAPAFPTSNFQSSNYFVDVVFETGTQPANEPPTVAITAPANNASFTAPASIAITANASDTDGTVSKVELFNGDTKLGEDLTSPYTYNWSGVQAGTYALTAKATDDKGAMTTSATVNVTVNAPANQAPSAAITSPANNATFTAPASITLSASASDADGSISKVEFYSGTTKLGEDLTSPYSYSWENVPAGSYQLTARAIDNAGATGTSAAVNITVSSPANTSPTVAITSPANNTTFTAPATITIAASASDTDGSVAKVEFFQGTTKLGEDTSSPYSFTWSSVVAGTYTLTARATDNLGATTTSAEVNVTVNAPANSAPTVAITSPANNATFTAPATINIAASASDTDGTVSKVEFYNGSTKLGEDLTSPYNYSWSSVPAGSYTLSARATDNAGSVTSSDAVNVTVNAASSGCPCTVFQASAAPSGSLQNDGRALQLGMKFRSSVNGSVTGVRFYKQSGNTGTHTGQLYSSGGALLASVVFQNETASGWQQASFSSPVAITAGTTYVITYHSSAGYYSVDDRGLSQAIVNGPLRGLANGESGRNGVYRYSNTPAFPTSNYQASNYWVDVVFNTTLTAGGQAQTAVMTGVEKGTQPTLLAFPNPSSGEGIQLEVQGIGSMEEFSVTVHNSIGSELIRLQRKANKEGNFIEEIKFAPRLPHGAYTIKVQSKSIMLGQTIIIDK
ncbi:protein of unknown function [Pontibacter chinhatensis]|uniref:PKD/Chitinase domain-containing protein n=1 Tax=Pontibacter chinhatensis TaxID=1436961 RepID=A0A1I2WZK5_9BACT|nr:protein of unknown function [Pontibacter chinhatensis]